MTGYWADLAAPDFLDLPADTVAVLPLGAIEQHGPHLLVSVDRDLVNGVIARTLRHVDAGQTVLVLPTLEITKSNEHLRHPGTLTLSARTLMSVLEDITESVALTGIHRLVFFNGHGGNSALLEIAAREARIAHDMLVATTSWFAFADTTGLDPTELAYDLHAGLTETAAMLAAHPDRVDMTRARNFRTAMQDWEAAKHQTGLTGQPARPGWIIDDLSPDGACGNAAAATGELGTQLLDSAAAGFAEFLRDFASFELRGRAP